ncbi:MAG: hypothetical protein ACI91Z_001621 [Yoonia sp.]|jgi:hypothetical protein
MRRLTLIVIALAGIYSGYWFIGASATERAANAQMSELNTAGWTVEFTDLSTAGFPSRFDTSLTDLHLESPDRRTVWDAPFVQALSLSYKPNEVILALPEQQTLIHGGVALDIASSGLLASLTFAPTPALGLVNLTAETGPLTMSGPNSVVFSATKGIAALRLAGPTENQYDAYLDLDGFTLPSDLRRILDPAGKLPASFAQITLDSSIVFDHPIDRFSPVFPPRPTQITLNGMTVTWGDLQLRGKGEVTVDISGIPTGRITISAQNWRELIGLAVNTGLLDQGVANTAQNMGAVLAGGSAVLSVPITFQNGLMSLGPIPLGPAPRLF